MKILNFIFSYEWSEIVVYIIFALIAVFFVSAIKYICVKACERKGKVFDKKKYGFLFAIIAFIFACGLSFAFQVVHNNGLQNIGRLVAYTDLCGTMTGGIYSLLAQPIRKVVVKAFLSIFRLTKKGKENITPTDVLDEFTKATDNPETAVDDFYKAIQDVTKK